MGMFALIFQGGTYGFAVHLAVLWGSSLFTSCTVLCGILLRPIVLSVKVVCVSL